MLDEPSHARKAHHADIRGQKDRGGDLDHDSERATRMLSRIRTLLRRTLEEESIAEIPLAQELEFTDQHLEVEQIRLGERLRVTTEFLQTCLEQLCR